MPSARDIRHIDAAVEHHGLGRFDWTTATAVGGRNDNWLGGTTTGRRVFLKTIVGSPAEVIHGVRRTAAFYQVHRDTNLAELVPTAPFLGQDEHTAVQIFEGLEDARDGRALASEDAFTDAFAARAGEIVGALHAVAPATLSDTERSLPALPRQGLLDPLTPEMFYGASTAQLAVWRILQQDPAIADPLRRLERERAAEAPIHGDLRLDQFLGAGTELRLVDWEMFQLGDPAADVGGFAGEWVHHAVRTFLRARTNTGTSRPSPVPNIALTASWPPWHRVRPRVVAFWNAYRTARPADSACLATRAALFTGRHLLIRVLADTQHSARLDGFGHALLQLGKMMLIAPQRFVTVLGFSELP